jgi:hypothetical protein
VRRYAASCDNYSNFYVNIYEQGASRNSLHPLRTASLSYKISCMNGILSHIPVVKLHLLAVMVTQQLLDRFPEARVPPFLLGMKSVMSLW